MNAVSEAFDVFAVPLHGLTVIEASAGTGKTHAITELYLRLLLQAEIPVDRILVVTYTKAATQELRTRLREAVGSVQRALGGGEASLPFVRSLLAHVPDHAAAARRLQLALDGFDEAAIFTIHAFCQRVLADVAFESGAPFAVELVTDESELLQEVVDDFWRRHIGTASPVFVQYVLSKKASCSPDHLCALLRMHVGRPDLAVRPSGPPAPVEAEEARFRDACAIARELWPSRRAAVAEGLRSPALNQNSYRPAGASQRLVAMDAWLASASPGPARFKSFEKFTVECLRKATKKGQTTPADPFFDACSAVAATGDALTAAYAARLAGLKALLLREGTVALASAKSERRLQSYDDLLQRLAAALDGPRGAQLAHAVRDRYQAALIDEFQDTDPVQYRIVQHVWGGSDAPVVLVGDPKQAIYSFRGADVLTYLTARDATAAPRTLAVNWRTDPGLLRAVEALFRRHPAPFLMPSIQFQSVAPADKERTALWLPDDDPAPCRVWWLRTEGAERLVKREALRGATDVTADEIARLLHWSATGRARLGDRPLVGGDIAVLVSTHREGRLIRDALARRGVPCVQHALDSVFHTQEATELERVLWAVVTPGNGPRLRAALTTELLGVDAAALLALATNELEWEARVERFHQAHAEWRQHGFARMLRGLLAEHQVPSRLLAHADGERRLTNLLHLGELLQAEAARGGDHMDRLLEWLQTRRLEEQFDAAEQQLRLESDEGLVQIVTIHRSKGLEYPLVFCPFLWNGQMRTPRAPEITFHDPADDHRATLELAVGPAAADRELALQEELAERLRLAYVALTRARHRCYLVSGKMTELGTSPLGWLVHAPSDSAGASLQDVQRGVDQRDTETLRAEWEAIAAAVPEQMRIIPIPERTAPLVPPVTPPPRALAARTMDHPVPASWALTSFTALTADHEAERPDYDATFVAAPVVTARGPRTIADFPRGARAGRCLHAVFERFDFQSADASVLDAVVRGALAEHGFALDWTAVVSGMVTRVLATPLDAAGTVRLGTVALADRLDELEFTYPLAALDPTGVAAVLRAHGYDGEPYATALRTLDFRAVSGFMKGFIDCVFACDGRYVLIDYKSNWLGVALDDYTPDQLTTVIARERYFLQYLIYTVVVHRLLRLRVPGYDYERHFGGVYYLFLRGMDPRRGASTGVFADRPSRALVEALDALMGKGGAR